MQREVPFEPEAVLHELYSLEQIVSSIAAGSWAGGGGGDAQLPARFSADDAAAGLQEWQEQSGESSGVLACAPMGSECGCRCLAGPAPAPASSPAAQQPTHDAFCCHDMMHSVAATAPTPTPALHPLVAQADSEEWSEEEDGLDSRTRKRLERTTLSSTPGRRPTPGGGGGSARRRSGPGAGGGGGLAAQGSSGSLSAGGSGRRR